MRIYTPADIERELRRMEIQGRVLDGFRLVLVGALALKGFYEVATRSRLAWWDFGLVAFNVWFPWWMAKKIEKRRVEAMRAAREWMDAEMQRIALEINEKFLREEYDDE